MSSRLVEKWYYCGSSQTTRPSYLARMAKTTSRKLHPRNQHRNGYDLEALGQIEPELLPLLHKNPAGRTTIDFADPDAVKLLNSALLRHHYGVDRWDIPTDYLVPPIPGRADYLHYLGDLLAPQNGGEVPRGRRVEILDIGTGANCIYPIIGHHEYGWRFLASEVDQRALRHAKALLDANPKFKAAVQLKHQHDKRYIFRDIIGPNSSVDATMCNPPFHASAEEARKANLRKLRNLNLPPGGLNFGGRSNELWTEGGEVAFIRQMIRESRYRGEQVCWFTTLVSKKANLPALERALKKVRPRERRIIETGQGNKVSRILVWTFLSKGQRAEWADVRWG